MSNVTSVYKALVTRIEAVLTSHVRLKNPYDVAQNNEQFLKLGWGLAIGPAVNAELYLSNKLSTERSFIIPITRKYIAREFDATAKATTEKLLMEDVFSLASDFTTDSTLNDGTNHVKYIGDSGIEAIFADKDHYLVSNIEVTSTIIETL